MKTPEQQQIHKLRTILANVMKHQALGVAICFEAERDNVCDTMAADEWKRRGRLIAGDFLHPFDEALEGFMVDKKQLDAAQEMVKAYVKRESDLYDNAQREKDREA